MRIAQVATVDSSVRALLSGQIRALQEAGAEVTAICAPGPRLPELAAMGIPVRPVAMARRPSPRRDLQSLRALTRAFREGRYDAVITHTPKAGLLGPVAARLAGVPVIIHTVHGLLFHDQTPPDKVHLFRAAERWTAWWAGYLFFQSREDLETARAVRLGRPERLYYQGNGINLARFDPAKVRPRAEVRQELGLEPDDLVVGTVSRLVYEKGLGEFLEAAVILLTQFPQLRFLVVGPREPDRPDRVPDERLAALEATRRFIFTGRRRDVADLYGAMDIFVLPSHREGVPRAPMEAAAMGLPVVATRIRGCREVVRDGETGLLVPVRDAQAVAEAVAEIIRSGAGPAMGAAGRAMALAEFDEQQVNHRILTALAGILGRPVGAQA